MKVLLKIGPYSISEWPDDNADYWISREDGEGMGTSEEKLVKMFEDFWKAEF